MQYADKDDHDAQVRLGMVLANAFMISGDRENSQIWFSKARHHAVKNGDQPSIEALLYNRTAFGISIMRSDRCIGIVQPADLAIVRKEVQSATNLQSLTRISALANHIYLWSARLSILEENFPKAIVELASARQGVPFAEYNFNQQMIELEMVYCLARAGRLDEAQLNFESIDLSAITRLDLDEQLVAAFMQNELETLSSSFRKDGDTHGRFSRLKLEYASSRALLRKSLSEWSTV